MHRLTHLVHPTRMHMPLHDIHHTATHTQTQPRAHQNIRYHTNSSLFQIYQSLHLLSAQSFVPRYASNEPMERRMEATNPLR